ncbi:MAG: lasso peptide biosynthesis protein, partial [Bryobacterales bacterium]|nr:lasso peptide biosynthesis protein [Bryobacterales bacterium]
MPRTASHSALGFHYENLPTEMRLMLACVRWPLTSEDAAHVRTLAASDSIAWELLLSLCVHHRVAPLVYRALTTAGAAVPAYVAAQLKQAATENAIAAFRYLAETRRLCDLLQQAGVPVRVLKGVPLSQRVFNDPSLRDVGDIDLLISPGMEEIADRILLTDGFRRNDPAARLTPARRRSWRRHGKDYTYLADRSGFEVDLHWRLFRNPCMPGNALADPKVAPSERVQLGETALAALPVQRSFLYLCVHGALDGWFRMKSLVDVAALWRGFTAELKASITDCAREHHVLPELAAALAVSQQLSLLDAEALSPAMQLQAGSREAQWILRYAHSEHTAQDFRPSPDAAGSWALKRYELGLRRGPAYRFEIVRRVLFRPRVWEHIDLPDILFPLYSVLSPFEWYLFHRHSRSTAPAQPRVSRWQRWRGLPPADRKLLVEAFLSL